MSNLHDIQQRHINLMMITAETLSHILKNVSIEQATSLRDGPEGWTILEILCHLRDFDTIFRDRAQMMLDKNHPALPAFDHEAMAIESAYNDEDFAYAFDGFMASRKQTKLFFEGLSDGEWQRSGIHPERGEFSMTDAVIQVGHHDCTHLEQITKLLEREIPGSGALPSDSDDENLT
ncbi:MAG: DinB family protein [Phototrophicaceae bacterium]